MPHKRKGFTLAELMIVILIAGILAVISGSMMSGIEKKAALAEAVAAMTSLRHSLREYFVKHGHYPATRVEVPGEPGNFTEDGLNGPIYSIYMEGSEDKYLNFKQYINRADFQGNYLWDVNYFVTVYSVAYPNSNYFIACKPDPDGCQYGSASQAPKRGVAATLTDNGNENGTIWLLETGEFTQRDVKFSGFTDE